MKHLVFLLEEPSMERVLEIIVPKIFPHGQEITFQFIVHEGKSDLDKSIPRKLRAWQTPNTQFIVVRDNDGKDCVALKHHLKGICGMAGRPDTLIRLVCQSLESWFLGDLSAVETAFALGGVASRQSQAKYRQPDSLSNPHQELKKIVKTYGKVGGARSIAPHLNINQNCSISFNAFVKGIERLSVNDI